MLSKATEREDFLGMDTVELFKLLKINWRRIVVGIIIFFLMPLIFDYGLKIYYGESPTERLKVELTDMYKELTQLPGAVLVSDGRSLKHGEGSMYYNFSTERSTQEVLDYYDQELKKKGWVFKDVDIGKEWGEPTGMKSIRYTRGKYLARIYYDETKQEDKTTYSIFLSFYRTINY
ncbi:hypothetical protein [Sporomusa sphaeroides]|uniref:hypothetical protein n=1 Tax=Sporomusa sphaeroides TaxID=47679 RepID=UPI002BC14F34|nr:hypothetical protein [Sporomusa sphaeroides]HML32119.1 hypothetical protein [Sporomusa sphaeroides]